MTRKDYVKAADIVSGLHKVATNTAEFAYANGAEDGFVFLFKSDNPRFDETRFREACKKGAK